MTRGPAHNDAGACEAGCYYPMVQIGSAAADASAGALQAGDKVMAPCRGCGSSPLEEWDWLETTLTMTERAFSRLALDRGLSLYHWSPTRNRKQIIRRGLIPGRRPTVHATPDWRAPYVCFGDTVAWAWQLSGDQASAPSGSWDLWETRIGDLTDPKILPTDDVNGIHEVRTMHRVYKRHLWLVGTREKP